MEIKVMSKRYGMVKGKIGTRHNMRCPDGVCRIFVVRDKSRSPNVSSKVFCAFCNKFWDTEPLMLADHPESRVMVKQEETHLFMWWSSAPLRPAPEHDKTKSEHKDTVDYSKIYGFLSDEELDIQ